MRQTKKVFSLMLNALKRKELRKARRKSNRGAFEAYQLAHLAKLDQRIVLMVK